MKNLFYPHIFRDLGLHAVLVTKKVTKPLIKKLKIIKKNKKENIDWYIKFYTIVLRQVLLLNPSQSVDIILDI